MSIVYNAESAALPPVVAADITKFRDYLTTKKAEEAEEGKPPKERINTLLLDQMRPMEPQAFATLVQEISQTDARAQKYPSFQSLDDVHVVAYAVDDVGISGECLSGNTLVLYRSTQKESSPMVYPHELYHLKDCRLRGFPKTFAAHIIGEGRANIFGIHDVGNGVYPDYMPLGVAGFKDDYEKKIVPFLPDIMANLYRKGNDVPELLYGNDKYPERMGYILGTILAHSWHQTCGLRPAESLLVPPEQMIEPWLAGKPLVFDEAPQEPGKLFVAGRGLQHHRFQ